MNYVDDAHCPEIRNKIRTEPCTESCLNAIWEYGQWEPVSRPLAAMYFMVVQSRSDLIASSAVYPEMWRGNREQDRLLLLKTRWNARRQCFLPRIDQGRRSQLQY